MAQIRTRTFLRPIWIDFEIIRNFYDHQTEPESKLHSGGDSIHGQTKTTFQAMSAVTSQLFGVRVFRN